MKTYVNQKQLEKKLVVFVVMLLKHKYLIALGLGFL